MSTAPQIAGRFGHLIARSNYEGAHKLLTKAAQKRHSPNRLQKDFKRTVAYAPGPVRKVEIVGDILDDWPDKQRRDIGWVYISLFGDDYVEAVSVILAEENGNIRIRDVEWGRP
jgi:hypothetical protein